jgi:hypothetical protein
MAREIDAKVARVMNETTIAINVGEDAGVEPGNLVVHWRTVDVTDPDTGETLGSVRLPNLRLEVSEVYERFSLARVEYQTPNFLAGMFKPSKVIASSDRALGQERVQLAPGFPVTVTIDDSLLSAAAPDDAAQLDAESDQVEE